MPRKRREMMGQRFGKLVVIGRGEDYVHTTLHPDGSETTFRVPRWICRCDCGGTATVTPNNLVSCTTTSCGCKRRENMRRAATFRWRGENAEA